jgi:hypothetical protein
MQAFGGTAEVALFRNGNEVVELPDLHGCAVPPCGAPGRAPNPIDSENKYKANHSCLCQT